VFVRAAFWGSVATLSFAYVGYPAITLVRARLRPLPYRIAAITPSVTVIIAAHNESAVIGRKLASVVASDYLPTAMQIVVASDGSDDDTAAVARATGGDRVEVLDLPRVGKAQALNAAVAHASGEIIAFTDANSLLAPDALRRLVAPFADPAVGGVAGNQVYRPGKEKDAGGGELAYWDIDRRLKVAEASAGNAVSATGALYAIRHSLFCEVPEGVTDDFVTSVRIVSQGSRLVFADDAVAYEDVAESGPAEFTRKVRVMTRGLRGVILMRHLLDPRRHGFYSVQLFTQKVLKRLTVIPNITLAVSAPLAWHRGGIYRVATVAELCFAAAAFIGLQFPKSRVGRLPAFTLPAYFCMANAASLVALRNVVTGRRVVRWETAERATPRERVE